MQFNTNATNNDLVSDCTFLITGSYTGTIDYHINDRTRSANSALDEVVSAIMMADNRWEFEDNNYTNIPIGSTDLVAGQQDYEIEAGDFLNISEVAVKDDQGYWKVLSSVDRNKGTAQTLADLEHDDNDGLPLYYDKMGNSVFLYPKPKATDVTLSSGLRIKFQRKPSYFTTTDTTKEPGYNPLYHRLISLGMAIDYCISNELSRKLEVLRGEKDVMMAQLIDSYVERNKDEQPQMRLNNDDNDIEV